MVLICISLVICDAEHILMCLLITHISSFGKMSIQVFAYFSTRLVCVLFYFFHVEL